MEIQLSEEQCKKVMAGELKTKTELASKIWNKRSSCYGVTTTYLSALLRQDRLTLYYQNYGRRRKLYYVSLADQEKADWGINDRILPTTKATPNKVNTLPKTETMGEKKAQEKEDLWKLYEQGVPLHKALVLSRFGKK